MKGVSSPMLALSYSVQVYARLSVLVIACMLCGSGAMGETASRNVLLLYPYDNTQPSLNIPGGAIRKRLLDVEAGERSFMRHFLT